MEPGWGVGLLGEGGCSDFLKPEELFPHRLGTVNAVTECYEFSFLKEYSQDTKISNYPFASLGFLQYGESPGVVFEAHLLLWRRNKLIFTEATEPQPAVLLADLHN